MSGAARRPEPPRAGRSLTVELAGIPGSGKSRLARGLVHGLGERGIRVAQLQVPMDPSVPAVRRLVRKAAACAGTTAATPGHTARLVRAVLASGQPSRGEAVARVVQVLVAQQVAALAARTAGVSLVDEGLVQALWSIGLRGDVGPVLAALHSWPRGRPADVLVVLRVPLEVALARLTARTSRHSRTQLLPEAARLAELERGDRLLGELVTWWSARPPAGRQVCVVRQPEEDGDERALLVDRLETLLHKQP